MNHFKIVLFYKYLPLENPEDLREKQRELCRKLELKGRIIVADEGINATLEGEENRIIQYIEKMKEDPRFNDIDFKISNGTGQAFPKLSVKFRREIVAYRLGDDDIKPWEITGNYITAEQLHDWIRSGKRFYIVDMRNGFEQEVGYFKDSILSGWEHSENLPDVLPVLKRLDPQVPIVTVCTGGVRCEKASGFLVRNGFPEVYQLYGGIVTYMEKYPGEDFMGALYTFDDRLVMGFNMDDPERVIVGKCAKCNQPSENFINCMDDFCHRHFIACQTCLDGKKSIFCPMGCRDYSKEHPEAFGRGA